MLKVTCPVTGQVSDAKPLADGSARLPRGWRKHGPLYYSPEGWQRTFVMRAITFPVVSPIGIEWPDFRVVIKDAWGAVTGLANWTMTQLAKLDHVRTPGLGKMPKAPQVYLYPEARAAFPLLDPSTVVAVLHDVEAKYRSKRYQVIWTCESSLPVFRYPYPLPVPAQAWKASFSEDNAPVVSLRLGGQRIEMRLRGGPEFRRQLAGFHLVVNGAAKPGTLTLYRVRANLGDHRGAVSEREGKEQPVWRIMCKLSAWMPRRQSSAGDGTLQVILGGEAFASAFPDGRPPWVVNADHVHAWIMAHDRRRHRLAQDLKYEKRWPKRMRDGMAAKLDAICRKQHNRLDTWMHESTKSLAAFAVRQRVASVTIVRREPWSVGFPWFLWVERLRQKLDDRGLSLEVASGVVVEEKPSPLAGS